MIAYENDVLEIPERIKQMSVSELEKAETDMLHQLLKKNKGVKQTHGKLNKTNKMGIKFNI